MYFKKARCTGWRLNFQHILSTTNENTKLTGTDSKSEIHIAQPENKCMEDSVANQSMERRVVTIVHMLTGNDKKMV